MKFYKRRYNLKVGEQRIVRRFLFLPRSFNGIVRWLEFADIVQVVSKKYKWKSIDFLKSKQDV